MSMPAMKLIAAILGLLPLILPLATPRPVQTGAEVVVEQSMVIEPAEEAPDAPWNELPVLPLYPVGGIQL